MIQMVRGFGVDGLKRQFDDWRTSRTGGLSNVALKGVAFSVLDDPTSPISLFYGSEKFNENYH